MPLPKVPFRRGSRFQVIPRAFIRDPLDFVVRETLRSGDLFRIRLFHRTIHISTNLDVIRHVLQANHRNYKKGPLFRHLSLFLGQGLLTSEGDLWRRQRQLVQPAFYKSQLPGLFGTMTETALRFCDGLQARAASGVPLDITREMMQVTADIVLHALFSTTMEKDREEIYQYVMEAQDYSMYMTTHPWMAPVMHLNGRRRRIEERRAYFDEWIYRIIEERRRSADRPDDLLTMLVEAQDAESGQGMSNQQLRDEAITLFAAGHETSANALSWTLLLLARHPEVRKKLVAELSSVLGGRPPSWDDLPRLVYTRQVMEESMRLFPPAHAFGRIAIADDEILGYRIPGGSSVFFSVYALHRNPEFWPDPERFDPERFAPDREKERPKLAYMPFGAGPRMCIGNHFAQVEIQLLLALLLQRFEFELVPGQEIVPQPLVTLKPRDGILMKINRSHADHNSSLKNTL
ncbi:MAG: cytochrome P450 [Lewinellaceae bacterium]|nr:cytochrome P450 [Lewinellaceae bacterium]